MLGGHRNISSKTDFRASKTDFRASQLQNVISSNIHHAANHNSIHCIPYLMCPELVDKFLS